MPNKEEPTKKDKQDKKPLFPPDEDTLHTTDPQEHMKGPISSPMQEIKETAEEKGGDSPEDENERK